ncbi:DUF2513 domain-containing protein [Streptococcus sp. sy010]|uniref:DUF2513 domain-containing protein n=1 Tax=Streptococcus sp. sy010 TaxID=2600148 RepID=UPI0011B527AF|nr:DUF2513 domain-containing protein [Streptococcus sp. sy010]TWT16426.1 DUF2513 domain-containing protein [Streptococcus sp. sy010]
MKLNPDCVRQILLDVEKRAIYGNFVEYTNPQNFQVFPNHSPNEVLYHIRQCHENGFFLGNTKFVAEGCIIKDLSPAGHEFLANIRKDTNWNKTKDIAYSVGSTSLNAIKDIATQVISNLISNQFGK